MVAKTTPITMEVHPSPFLLSTAPQQAVSFSEPALYTTNAIAHIVVFVTTEKIIVDPGFYDHCTAVSAPAPGA